MGELRVMTWNVQNLFEPGGDSGPRTAAELAAKLASLAATIGEFEPHVLGLQEVGSEVALQALQAALTRPMRHRRMGIPDDRGIRVAYLSTRVLRDGEDIPAFPSGLLPVQSGDDQPGPLGPEIMTGMGRAALAVTIRANGRDVRVINTHLKSKLLSFPNGRFFTNDEDERARAGAYALYRRAAEAATVRSTATAELEDDGENRPLLVMGDFNDEPEAATTQIIKGPQGSELGTVGFSRPDAGDRTRLFNLAPVIPEDQRKSRVFRGRGELIDHIFASRFLVTEERLVEAGTMIAEGVELPSITENPNTRRGKPGSDHAAVFARFNF